MMERQRLCRKASRCEEPWTSGRDRRGSSFVGLLAAAFNPQRGVLVACVAFKSHTKLRIALLALSIFSCCAAGLVSSAWTRSESVTTTAWRASLRGLSLGNIVIDVDDGDRCVEEGSGRPRAQRLGELLEFCSGVILSPSRMKVMSGWHHQHDPDGGRCVTR